MKGKHLLLYIASVLLFVSCAPSVTSNLISGADLSKYNYVLWPSNTKGDQELDYVMFEAYNILKETRLEVISESQLAYYPLQETLISICHVSQDLRKSVITIDFKDGVTNLPVLYVKGSFGMGWGMSDDMRGALSALRKRMLVLFPKE
jgi:hypothetical protein